MSGANDACPSWARQDAVPVGLATELHRIPDAESSSSPESASCANHFDARIMHKVVPTTRYEMQVVIDASHAALSEAFGLPRSLIEANWITSSSPMELPGYENALVHFLQREREQKEHRRRRDEEQLQQHQHQQQMYAEDQHVLFQKRASSANIPIESSHSSESCNEAMSPSSYTPKKYVFPPPAQQYGPHTHGTRVRSGGTYMHKNRPSRSNAVPRRPQPLSSSVLDAYRDLAVALREQLELLGHHHHDERGSSFVGNTLSISQQISDVAALHEYNNYHCNYGERRPLPRAYPSSMERWNIGSNNNEEPFSYAHGAALPMYSRTLPLSKETCGFSTQHCHPDLAQNMSRTVVEKACRGLYRTVRNNTGVLGAGNYYTEYCITQNMGHGGICIGLSTNDFPLDKLLGSRPTSVGFHSTGHLVTSSGEWIPYGRPYNQGDTVALLINLSTSSCGGTILELYFFVNGFNCGVVRNPTLDSLNATLYPSVSLYREVCAKRKSTQRIQLSKMFQYCSLEDSAEKLQSSNLSGESHSRNISQGANAFSQLQSDPDSDADRNPTVPKYKAYTSKLQPLCQGFACTSALTP